VAKYSDGGLIYVQVGLLFWLVSGERLSCEADKGE